MIYDNPSLNKKCEIIPEEYCYLVIRKYTEDFFKPKEGTKLIQEKECLKNQNETLNILNSGYCSLHNTNIELSDITEDTLLISSLNLDLCDNEFVLYKIKPINVINTPNDFYLNKTNYKTNEFEIIKKLETKEEILNQFNKDRLLPKIAKNIFKNLFYNNKGRYEDVTKFFQYIYENFLTQISISELTLSRDYNHIINFGKNDVKRNIFIELLNFGYIKYFKETDRYKSDVIEQLVNNSFYDEAIQCINLLDDYNIEILKSSESFKKILRTRSCDSKVKQIINMLNIKIKGINIKLKIETEHATSVVEKQFDNINQIKTYLIKKYNVSFEQLLNIDLDGFSFYQDEDTCCKISLT